MRERILLEIHFLIAMYLGESFMYTNCSFSVAPSLQQELICFNGSILERSTISLQPICCKVPTSLFIGHFYESLSSALGVSLTDRS